MKVIKFTHQKERWLPFFLIAIMIFLALSVVLYFRENRYVNLGQYDVLSECKSIPEPSFSVPEGLYEQPFELEITAPSDYDIYYTTDGSIPTIRSPKYQKRIQIDPRINLNKNILYISTSLIWHPPSGKQNHCTVIRARCFKADIGYGSVKNVIYSPPDIVQHRGFQLIHILIEADSLFSPTKGIYVMGEKYYSKKTMAETNMKIVKSHWFEHIANYHERGNRWTRPAQFIVTDFSGKTQYNQNVRLKIHGGSTRAYPVKTLRIMADTIRGDNVIHYRFFDDLLYNDFKTILLRSSGNDQNRTMFKDAVLQQMVKGLGLDIQEYAPAVVYINGNYWGIHHIRERLDENYLVSKYGSTLDKVHILKHEGSEKFGLQYGDAQSLQSFKELVIYMQEKSMADEKAYQHVCTQMDIDNFIDYMIVQTFFANGDWIDNNIRVYKIEEQTETMKQKNIEAGKWRWLIFDWDYCLTYSDPSINMFDELCFPQFDDHDILVIFWGLLKNADFKKRFLNRYEFIIRDYLTTPYMLQHIEDFEERYQSEMERHIARWRQPTFYQEWQWRVDRMKTYIRKRPEIVLDQLEEFKNK